MKFLDFVERSNQSASRAQLIQLFEETLKGFGIDGFVYSTMQGGFVSNDKIKHGIERSYPEEWIRHYITKNYAENDPTYRFAVRARGIYSWKSLLKTQHLSKKEKLVMSEAEEAGLKNGLSLPIHGPYGAVHGFGFISHTCHDELDPNELSLLYAIGNQFHLVHSNLEGTLEAPLDIALSDRQKDILQWAAAGKSKPVIAEILGISADTVDNHFRQIFYKLRCNDRVVAVVKAIRFGLIQV